MTGAPLRLETATTMSPWEIIRLSSSFVRAKIQHAFQDTPHLLGLRLICLCGNAVGLKAASF